MNARTLAALLLVAATGCVDNSASVRLSAACFPPLPDINGICNYPAACSAVMVGNLAVDTTHGDGTLVWPIQADNERPNNATPDGATNTATAFITSYKISYSSANVSIPDVEVLDSTRTVEAAGTTVILIPVIPPGIATFLSINPTLLAEVRAEIRAVGHYGDGQSFETGPFSMVVNVANGTWTKPVCPNPATPTVIGMCPAGGGGGLDYVVFCM